MNFKITKKYGNPQLIELGIHVEEWRLPYDEILTDLSFMQITKPDAFLDAVRMVATHDFFFFCYFILNLPVNHPFLIARCYEIQDNQDNDMLYLWARDHYKSTLVTFAETIWRFTRIPDNRVALFSNSLKLIRPHFNLCKTTMENNELLKEVWHDVFWKDPAKDREIKWSVESGLYLKQNRLKDPSLGAYGLSDYMPTGGHFTEKKVDDLIDLRNIGTAYMMQKILEIYEMSDNLGSGDDTRESIIGTRYKYQDLYEYIAGLNMHKVSLQPAEVDENGAAKFDGIPVLLSKETLAKKKLKQRSVYRAQMLLDPMEKEEAAFKIEDLQFYDELPETLNYYIATDPASNPLVSSYKNLDYTVMMLLAAGKGNRIYLADMVRDRIGLVDKWKVLKDWHIRYSIDNTGYEEYATQKDREFFLIKMDEERFYFNITPLGGKEAKHERIGALAELFAEHKIFLPRNLFRMTKDRGLVDLIDEFIKDEYSRYPFVGGKNKDDMLDTLARVCDSKLKVTYPSGEIGAEEQKSYNDFKVSPLDDDLTQYDCVWGDL